MTTTATPLPHHLVPETALPAWRRLQAALLVATVPPCAVDPDTWTEATDVAAAVDGCSVCPALGPCGEYADAADERFGVWAGWDRSKRRSGPSR